MEAVLIQQDGMLINLLSLSVQKMKCLCRFKLQQVLKFNANIGAWNCYQALISVTVFVVRTCQPVLRFFCCSLKKEEKKKKAKNA